MPSLTSIAEEILARAKKIDAYMESQSIEYTSFDKCTLEQLPNELQDERTELSNAVNDLLQLSRGSEMHLIDISFNWTDVVALRVVHYYKLAQVVPVDGTASYAEIAAASGLKEDLCRRFIRQVMGIRVFDEDPKTKRVRHTEGSRLFATDQGFSDAMALSLYETGPSSYKVIDVWEKHGQDVADPKLSAFSAVNETADGFYDVLAKDPERGRRFGGAMQYFTRGDAWSLRHLLNSFDWQSIDKPGARIVDVGGGNGHVSQYLARHTKNIHFTVQDLAHVVNAAPALLPEDLKDRFDFEEHDFFTPQSADAEPPTAFFMRWIQHNWSDKYAVQLFKNLTPGMRKGSKFLIYDYVLEDYPVTEISRRMGFRLDGLMTGMFNAQERTAPELERLLKMADERFVVEAVRRPELSAMSVMEVSWAG